MRRHWLFWTGLILFVVNISIAQNSEKQVSTFYPPYFYIHAPSDSKLVQALHQKIQPQLARMENLLGKSSSLTLTIVLTRSDEEYYEATRYAVPEWSQAVVFIQKKLIYLKISSADDLLQSPGVLLHEIAHVKVDEFCRGARIPAWLNEGLAQYLSGESLSMRKKVLISNAIFLKRIISLVAMDSLLNFQQPQAELAYAQSLSTIDYIVSRHGVKTIPALLQALSKKRSIDFALQSVLGYDFIDFENEWYAYIYKEYHWLIILNFDNFLWISIAALIIMAILAVRWRNRIKLKKWEQEELTFSQENIPNVRPQQDFPDDWNGHTP